MSATDARLWLLCKGKPKKIQNFRKFGIAVVVVTSLESVAHDEPNPPNQSISWLMSSEF